MTWQWVALILGVLQFIAIIFFCLIFLVGLTKTDSSGG